MRLPGGFLPEEDQGYFFVNVQLPDAASLNRTESVVDQVRRMLAQTDGVENVITVSGFGLLSDPNLPNIGTAIAILRPWHERRGPGQAVQSMVGQLMAAFSTMPSANIIVFNPPSIPGLGIAGGFDMRLGIEGQSPQQIASVMGSLIYKANQLKEVSRVYSTYSASVPHIQIDLDRARAQLMNLPVSEVFATLRAHLGSQYVNDFNILGRVYKVKVQDDARFRDQPNRIDQHYVRSTGGSLVLLRTLVKLSTTLGPHLVNRYNP